MKDYKVLTNRKISVIVHEAIEKVAPTCLDNREGMTRTQENDFVDLLMSKLNVDEKQARFLMKDKEGNYRKKLLEIEGIKEDYSLDDVFEYIDASKHNTLFVLILALLCVIVTSAIEIAMVIQQKVVGSIIVGLLLSVVVFAIISSSIKLKEPKYKKISNDELIKDEISIAKIKLKTVNELSNHPPHIVCAYGLKIIGINKNKKVVSIIYPLHIVIPDKFSINTKKAFNNDIKAYYGDCSFTYLRNHKFALTSNKNFKKIVKHIIDL